MDIAPRIHTTRILEDVLPHKADVSAYIQGAVYVERAGAYVRPWRFVPAQLKALGSCAAWHPGLYRQMARTTAGVRIALKTDATHLFIPLAFDEEPKAVAGALDALPEETDKDAVVVCVDGAEVALKPAEFGEGIYLDLYEKQEMWVTLPLPGLGCSRDITIYLPSLRGARVGQIEHDGSFLEAQPAAPKLLVLGDAFAQGFLAGTPHASFPARLAAELGLDVINQGLFGEVFQPGTLFGLRQALAELAHIVVFFGASYLGERCHEREVSRSIYLYLQELEELWPDVEKTIILPREIDTDKWRVHPGSCYGRLHALITNHVHALTLRYGAHFDLVSEEALLDATRENYVEDSYVSAAGADMFARRLAVYLKMCVSEGDARAQSKLALTALSILRNAPRRAFGLIEPISRGLVELLFAEKGCVLAKTHDGILIIWGDNVSLVEDVIATLEGVDTACVLEPKIVRIVSKRLGLEQISPYHLCIYSASKDEVYGAQTMMLDLGDALDIPIAREYTIDELGPDALDFIYEHYEHAEWLERKRTEYDLKEGNYLGGYSSAAKDELVGFIGVHTNGSMGMLQVLPNYQRKGWGEALETALINKQVRQGMTPFCEVFPENKASIQLQKKLGFQLLPANECCYLSPKVYTEDESISK